MEKDKPWALMSEKGLKQGFLEGNWQNEATLSNNLQQRVYSKCPATQSKNPGHVRVGRLPCSWSIQYSVLSLLFSLKVVANGGLGIDHLGVEGDPHAWCSQLCHYSYCHGSASGIGTEDFRLLNGTMSKCPKLKPAPTV